MGRKKRIPGIEDTVGIDGAGDPFPGIDRVTLLERIGELGSIAKAAKAAGVSYKTAWETVDAVNNLAGFPLVERTVGGRSGGGTVLTEKGREVVRTYRVIREEHRKFLASIRERIGVVDPCYPFNRRITMRISARNVFAGKVAAIRRGAVNAEVVLALPGGQEIAAVVTNGAVGNLGLKEGMDAYAIVKASSVLIGKGLKRESVSARNVLRGKIAALSEGPVSAEVTVVLGNANTLAAVITEESLRSLDLKVGEEVCAVFKASSVILGIDG